MDKENKTKSKVFETYAEDMAKVIEDDKSGLIKKIIHEEEQHEIEKRNLSPESKKNKFFLLLGWLLILISLITLFYFMFGRQVPTVPIQKQFMPIIFTDKSSLLDITGLKKDEIAQNVLNKVNGTLVKNGGIEGIYLTLNQNPVGLQKFIEAIDGNFVFGNNNFVEDNFLMGVVNDTTKDFFILLKVRSTADVFNNLRNWEGKMFSDLHGFLGMDISLETKYLLSKSFEDGFIVNKNARILYDNNGKIVMMYVLADDNSVVITDNENAAQEVMLRLASSQIKK